MLIIARIVKSKNYCLWHIIYEIIEVIQWYIYFNFRYYTTHAFIFLRRRSIAIKKRFLRACSFDDKENRYGDWRCILCQWLVTLCYRL